MPDTSQHARDKIHFERTSTTNLSTISQEMQQEIVCESELC